MSDKSLTKKVRNYGEEIGLDCIGFVDPEHFAQYPNKNRPSYFQKDSRVLLIAGMYMHDISLDIWTRTNRSGDGFHFLDSILENKLYLIKDFLNQKGFESKIIPYEPGIYLKDAGVLAGIGVIGKNNLLITNSYGCQIRLRAMVSDAPIVPGTPIKKNQYCKECEKCIESCPADALTKNGFDRKKCLNYNVENLQKVSKYGEIWCNKCIITCPIGVRKEELFNSVDNKLRV
jgi:epoxyqueuosine reductase